LIGSKLGGVLKERERTRVAGKAGDDGEPGGELLDWFRDQYSRPPSVAQLTRDQLLATFASIYNLSNALTYVVFDLAADPACVEELRKELLEVTNGDGIIDKTNIVRLVKLDSFIRESQRLSPTSLGKSL
jgi:hypothetical protein